MEPVTVYPDVPTVTDPTLPTLPAGAAPAAIIKMEILRESILKNEMDARGKILDGLRR